MLVIVVSLDWTGNKLGERRNEVMEGRNEGRNEVIEGRKEAMVGRGRGGDYCN
jgi:hypothetical protein